MIYYAVEAMKQVFSNPDFNEHAIYFYTFDEVLHQYDFSGLETKRVIMDPTISKSNEFNETNFL